MPFGLLKYGLSRTYPAKRHFAPAGELKPSYDVVIIGGGGQGLPIRTNPLQACVSQPLKPVLDAMAEFGGGAVGLAALRGLNQGG